MTDQVQECTKADRRWEGLAFDERRSPRTGTAHSLKMAAVVLRFANQSERDYAAFVGDIRVPRLGTPPGSD